MARSTSASATATVRRRSGTQTGWMGTSRPPGWVSSRGRRQCGRAGEAVVQRHAGVRGAGIHVADRQAGGLRGRRLAGREEHF
eukprot:5952936-Prymnesium_polylepis.1